MLLSLLIGFETSKLPLFGATNSADDVYLTQETDVFETLGDAKLTEKRKRSILLACPSSF